MHIKDLSNNTVFNGIIKVNPYLQLLTLESYTQISEEYRQLLNTHWRKIPWMLMAVSQFFSDAVLINRNQALLLVDILASVLTSKKVITRSYIAFLG